MILSIWKPKYKVIEGKNKIFSYTLFEGDINIKGTSNYKVIYCCDNSNCKNKKKKYSTSRHHLKRLDVQICNSCQKSGKNNPRYGDNRTWEEIHGIDKSEKLKNDMSNRLVLDNPSYSSKVNKKREETIKEKYGVENVFQLDEVKEKSKKTNLEKYGNEIFTKTTQYLEKTKSTNREKYGSDWQLQSDHIKNKVKNNNLEKYGVEWTLQLGEVKDTIRKTNFEKYGYPNAAQNKSIYDKIIKTNLEKYGTNSPNQSDEFRLGKFILTNHPNYIKYISGGISLFKCDCDENHNFKIKSYLFTSRYKNKTSLCTICNPIDDKKSIKEKDLLRYIKSIYNGEIISGYKDKLEIDIYIPEYNIGIEFNGLYWHSELYKEKNYHIDKTNYFKEKGIRIIHIWEDDWDNKCNIIKSQILNFLNNTQNRIYARKTIVKEVNNKLSKEFLSKNHLQGNVNSSIKLGLYYNEELVSLMTFDHFEGRKKMKKDEWNLNRFCNKLNNVVIGGSSKLLKYFINNYNVKKVISYADNDWSDGNLYKVLGFNKLYESGVDYKYIVDNVRKHKSNYRKSKTNISESKLDLLKIYDCGKIKFEKVL